MLSRLGISEPDVVAAQLPFLLSMEIGTPDEIVDGIEANPSLKEGFLRAVGILSDVNPDGSTAER